MTPLSLIAWFAAALFATIIFAFIAMIIAAVYIKIRNEVRQHQK